MNEDVSSGGNLMEMVHGFLDQQTCGDYAVLEALQEQTNAPDLPTPRSVFDRRDREERFLNSRRTGVNQFECFDSQLLVLSSSHFVFRTSPHCRRGETKGKWRAHSYRGEGIYTSRSASPISGVRAACQGGQP